MKTAIVNKVLSGLVTAFYVIKAVTLLSDEGPSFETLEIYVQ